MNVTDNLIRSVDAMLEAIGPEDIEQAKLCLLDYIPVLAGGYSRSADKVQAYTGCFSGPLSLSDEAFICGYAGHLLELDDGHRKAMSHPGVCVLSALMPYACAADLSGMDLIRGIVAGYEYAVRIACSIQPAHKKRGFHTTATCGIFGGAMAIACAAGYDHDTKKRILSAAVTAASGTLALQDDGSEMKPLNPAVAAEGAVLAVRAGQMELAPPSDPLGGERGFLRLYGGSFDRSYFEEGYRGEPMIRMIYRKLHASCRHSHSPIDCALRLRESVTDRCDRIEKITVETYDLGIKGHDHRVWDNANDARLSTPYCVACALIYGAVSTAQFEPEVLADSVVRALAQKVTVAEGREFTAALPDRRGAALTIRMADGEVLSDRVDRPKGEPENPVTYAELVDKSRELLREAGVDDDRIDGWHEAVRGADTDPRPVFAFFKEVLN